VLKPAWQPEKVPSLFYFIINMESPNALPEVSSETNLRKQECGKAKFGKEITNLNLKTNILSLNEVANVFKSVEGKKLLTVC